MNIIYIHINIKYIFQQRKKPFVFVKLQNLFKDRMC